MRIKVHDLHFPRMRQPQLTLSRRMRSRRASCILLNSHSVSLLSFISTVACRVSKFVEIYRATHAVQRNFLTSYLIWSKFTPDFGCTDTLTATARGTGSQWVQVWEVSRHTEKVRLFTNGWVEVSRSKVWSISIFPTKSLEKKGC